MALMDNSVRDNILILFHELDCDHANKELYNQLTKIICDNQHNLRMMEQLDTVKMVLLCMCQQTVDKAVKITKNDEALV